MPETLRIGLEMVRAGASAMAVTLRNLLRKPITVHYPDVVRPYPDRFRGVLALTYDPETREENCIGCRLCEYICPPQVIKVEMLKAEKRNYAKIFFLELYACEFCELCVQVCPTDAIIMLKTFDLAVTDRRELLLDKDRLHALGAQFEASWATGNRLRAMQAPPAKGGDKGAPAEKAAPAAKAAPAGTAGPASAGAAEKATPADMTPAAKAAPAETAGPAAPGAAEKTRLADKAPADKAAPAGTAGPAGAGAAVEQGAATTDRAAPADAPPAEPGAADRPAPAPERKAPGAGAAPAEASGTSAPGQDAGA